MCNYFSCIITRKLEVLWLKTSSSHEDIIQQFQIDDTKPLENRDFVRIEIRPDNPSKLTRNKQDWSLHVDEIDTLPYWFTKAQNQAEAKCWSAWKQSVADQLAIDKEERTFKDVGIGYAYDSAKVFVYGNVTIEAHDNATVRAHDNVTVQASDNAAVEAYDNVTIDAYYKATIEAYNNATVEAYYKATIRAYGNVTVEAHDNVAVEAYDNVTVRAYSSANKVQILSSTATVIYQGKVYVRKDAQVQFVEGEFLAANYTPL